MLRLKLKDLSFDLRLEPKQLRLNLKNLRFDLTQDVI